MDGWLEKARPEEGIGSLMAVACSGCSTSTQCWTFASAVSPPVAGGPGESSLPGEQVAGCSSFNAITSFQALGWLQHPNIPQTKALSWAAVQVKCWAEFGWKAVRDYNQKLAVQCQDISVGACCPSCQEWYLLTAPRMASAGLSLLHSCPLLTAQSLLSFSLWLSPWLGSL